MRLFDRIKDRLLGVDESGLDPTTVSHADAVRWFERRRGEYDRLLKAAAPYVDRQGVVLDVGANIGYFSARLVRRTGFAGHLYLFEPVPHLAALCRETFAGISGCTATVLEHGLGEKNATLQLSVAGNGNIGWNTLESGNATPDMTLIEVRVRQYDDLGLDRRPCFIKIDVEGAEYRVLRGMRSSLAGWRPRPVLLCEVGWGRRHPAWQEELDAFADLEALGYRFQSLDGRPVRVADLQETTDILCLPVELA